MHRPPLSSSQNIEHKQSIQFLTFKDINPSIRLIIDHYAKINKTTPQQIQMSNVSAHLEKFLKFVIEKNTSFVKFQLKQIIRQNYGNNQVIGCCINLDIKDLISSFDTTMNFAVFQGLGMFTQKLKNWLYRLGDSARGDYLYNVVTVFVQNELHNNPVDYILKGIAFSKVIGWKNILYPTSDPFLMLKFGAQIKGTFKTNMIQNTYVQKNLNMDNDSQISQISQNKVQNQLIELNKVSFDSFTYVMALKLDQTKIHYVDFSNNQKQNQLNENYLDEEKTMTKKLYIFPKL